MTIRVAAIGVCHWHSIYDSAYLRHLAAMEDVDIVGVHDDQPDIAAHRVSEIGGGIPTFTCYSDMLDEVDPDSSSHWDDTTRWHRPPTTSSIGVSPLSWRSR